MEVTQMIVYQSSEIEIFKSTQDVIRFNVFTAMIHEFSVIVKFSEQREQLIQNIQEYHKNKAQRNLKEKKSLHIRLGLLFSQYRFPFKQFLLLEEERNDDILMPSLIFLE